MARARLGVGFWGMEGQDLGWMGALDSDIKLYYFFVPCHVLIIYII